MYNNFIALALATLVLPVNPGFANDAGQDEHQASGNQHRDFSITTEFGALWQQRNDVAIPGGNNAGTRIDLLDIENPVEPFYRVSGYIDITDKHRVSGLYAPFAVTLKGKLREGVSFRNEEFNADANTSAYYKFNSYRMSWLYKMSNSTRYVWHVGISGKIRDAAVSLTQAELTTKFTNVGFVPLLHTTYVQQLPRNFSLHAELYGAAAPQGRAIDLGVKVMQEIRPRWLFGGGFRTLEGGADNERVYSFAWLHYAYFAISYRS